MRIRYLLPVLLAAVLLPSGPLSAQQCVTAEPDDCTPTTGGRCVAKLHFSDSSLKVEATGACTINATACTLPRNKLNLWAEDLGINQQNGTLIQTECTLYASRNKCVTYEITQTPINSSECSDINLTIFATPSNLNVSPRICQCSADLQSCQRGTPPPTAGVNGFWPSGADPISRRVGGTSHFWWCNQVLGTGSPACFGGYQLPSGTYPPTTTVGSSFPIKFSLFYSCGTPPVVNDAQVLLSIQLISPCEDENGNPTFCPINPVFPGSSELDNPPPLYRLAGDHYQFNWVPQQAGTYDITSIFLNYNVPPQTIRVVVE